MKRYYVPRWRDKTFRKVIADRDDLSAIGMPRVKGEFYSLTLRQIKIMVAALNADEEARKK